MRRFVACLILVMVSLPTLGCAAGGPTFPSGTVAYHSAPSGDRVPAVIAEDPADPNAKGRTVRLPQGTRVFLLADGALGASGSGPPIFDPGLPCRAIVRDGPRKGVKVDVSRYHLASDPPAPVGTWRNARFAAGLVPCGVILIASAFVLRDMGRDWRGRQGRGWWVRRSADLEPSAVESPHRDDEAWLAWLAARNERRRTRSGIKISYSPDSWPIFP